MDHCIVYFSCWNGHFEEKDLRALIDHCRPHNAQVGVTGVTLYVRGHIIQVLEGQKLVVEDLYERIQHDQRHTDVMTVLDRPITQRLFARWSMGYETMTSQQLDEIKAVVNLDDSEQDLINPADNIILKTIRVFYDSNRYN